MTRSFTKLAIDHKLVDKSIKLEEVFVHLLHKLEKLLG